MRTSEVHSITRRLPSPPPPPIRATCSTSLTDKSPAMRAAKPELTFCVHPCVSNTTITYFLLHNRPTTSPPHSFPLTIPASLCTHRPLRRRAKPDIMIEPVTCPLPALRVLVPARAIVQRRCSGDGSNRGEGEDSGVEVQLHYCC